MHTFHRFYCKVLPASQAPPSPPAPGPAASPMRGCHSPGGPGASPPPSPAACRGPPGTPGPCGDPGPGAEGPQPHTSPRSPRTPLTPPPHPIGNKYLAPPRPRTAVPRVGGSSVSHPPRAGGSVPPQRPPGWAEPLRIAAPSASAAGNAWPPRCHSPSPAPCRAAAKGQKRQGPRAAVLQSCLRPWPGTDCGGQPALGTGAATCSAPGEKRASGPPSRAVSAAVLGWGLAAPQSPPHGRTPALPPRCRSSQFHPRGAGQGCSLPTAPLRHTAPKGRTQNHTDSPCVRD